MADEGTFLGELQRGWQRFWRLSWWWKGPILGGGGFVLLIIVASVATGGTSDEPPKYPTGSLTVTEPVDGATVDTEEIVIRGTAPPGAEVRRDIRGGKKDDKFNADANGQWEYRTKLDEGDNDFDFFLQDAKDVKAKLTVKYAPPVIVEPTPEPTPSPEATPTPTPEPSIPAVTAAECQYLGEVGEQTSDVGSAFSDISELAGRDDILSDEWIFQMAVQFAVIQLTAEAALALDPPASLDNIHSGWLSILDTAVQATELMTEGIDEIDASKIDAAGGLIIDVGLQTQELTPLIDDFTATRSGQCP